MQRNVFAYTAPGCSDPDYLSINEEVDGRVVASARGRDSNGKSVTVNVELPIEQLAELNRATFRFRA